MPKTLQMRGAVTGTMDTRLGVVREIQVDVTRKEVRVMDGVTAGGIPIARRDLDNVLNASFKTKAVASGLLAASSDLSDVDDAAVSFTNIKQAATTTATGVVELLTNGEMVTGADTTRAATAANLVAKMAAPGPIGGTTPDAITGTSLSIAPDTDADSVIGRTKIGSPSGDFAGWGHFDQFSGTGYAFAQDNAGKSIINAVTGQTISERINNSEIVSTSASIHTSILSNGGTYAYNFQNSHGSTPWGIKIDFNSASPNNNAQAFINCVDATTARFKVMSTGNCQNLGNSYGGFSDRKLKRDFADAGSQWKDVKALARLMKKFRFKSNVVADPNAPAFLGLVAQEAELISPGIVCDNSDFVEEVIPDLDDKGEEQTDSNGKLLTKINQKFLGTFTKSISYSIMYLKGFKALGECLERTEIVETQIDALGDRLTSIEARLTAAGL